MHQFWTAIWTAVAVKLGVSGGICNGCLRDDGVVLGIGTLLLQLAVTWYEVLWKKSNKNIIEYPPTRSNNIKKDQKRSKKHVASCCIHVTYSVPDELGSDRGIGTILEIGTVSNAQLAGLVESYFQDDQDGLTGSRIEHVWWSLVMIGDELVMIGDLTWGKADENRWSGEVLDPPQPSLRAKVFLPVFRQRQRLNN